jgi:hypothetical protein
VVIGSPIDAELDGEQPLDAGGDLVLSVIRRLDVVARLAVGSPCLRCFS